MSSRGIARLPYLKKVLLYIIYLSFWQFYFQWVLCVFSMLSVGLKSNLIDSSLFISLLLIISFGKRRRISSFLLGLWKNKYLVLLIFIIYIYIYVYKSREKGSVDISSLINEIRKVKILDKNIATNDTKKLVIYNKKWKKTHKAINI